jgi:hypothetical protein
VQSGPLIVRTPFINVIERARDVTERIDETVTYTITPDYSSVKPAESKQCTIKQGDNVSLRVACALGVPLDSIQLYKNGQPVSNDQQTRRHVHLDTYGNNDVRLSINDARLVDTGDYSALINGILQPIIRLDVQPRELQVQMIDLLRDTFNENETLTIDCRFSTIDQNDDYRWFKDNQLLSSNDRIDMRKNAANDVLIVQHLQMSDAGVYELKNATNILRTPSIRVLPVDKSIPVEQQRPQVASKLVHEGNPSSCCRSMSEPCCSRTIF